MLLLGEIDGAHPACTQQALSAIRTKLLERTRSGHHQATPGSTTWVVRSSIHTSALDSARSGHRAWYSWSVSGPLLAGRPPNTQRTARGDPSCHARGSTHLEDVAEDRLHLGHSRGLPERQSLRLGHPFEPVGVQREQGPDPIP